MPMVSKSGQLKRPVIIIGTLVPLGVVVAAVMVVMTSASASPTGGSNQAGHNPKRSLPANINPNKTPILDPSKIKKEPMTPLTKTAMRRQALAWVAKAPTTRVACFMPDGSLAGVVELDKVNPSAPITTPQAAEVCGQWPGSRRITP